MPELPEVETVARTLEPMVRGRTIREVQILHKPVWQGEPGPGLLPGRTIQGTGRRGKVLLINFVVPAKSDEQTLTGLAFHLKMTGRLFVYPQDTQPGKHTRLILDLDDNTRLFFDDMRTFGYARAVNPAALAAWPFWQSLGPEPLEIGATDFVALFQRRNRPMKALLLDQTVLAGVGNIYADESLFRAGIRPDARSGSVPENRLRALHKHLAEVLNESIEACGSSIRDYRTARGDAGAFQNAFKVYGRGGEPCLLCGRALKHSKVAGRTTVWCSHCQP